MKDSDVGQPSDTMGTEYRAKDAAMTQARRRAANRSTRAVRSVPTRWRRDLGFLLGIVTLCLATIFVFSSAGGAVGSGHTNQANTGIGPVASPTTTAPATPVITSSYSAQVVAATTRDYALPEPYPGVMQPSIDQRGDVWFGEMLANALARLDPRTGAVSSWKAPDGQNNIMATAVDDAGNVWFTEQTANYIGRFDPATAQFTTYPLAQVNGHSAAPQDLKFDGEGNLWFTEVNAARIGRLDPRTGAITTWSIPAPPSGGPALPFCLAVTSSGPVWFGNLSGGVVGRLDPTTGHVDLYRLQSTQTAVYAMNEGANGIIWFTELEGGKLGRIDPATGSVTEIPVPVTSAGRADGMYGIQVTGNGDVWFTSAATSALIRYIPRSRSFTLYQLRIPSSIPFGISFDRQGNLWFTASTNPNYVGVMSLG
jgi:virginiamycin B lyase